MGRMLCYSNNNFNFLRIQSVCGISFSSFSVWCMLGAKIRSRTTNGMCNICAFACISVSVQMFPNFFDFLGFFLFLFFPFSLDKVCDCDCDVDVSVDVGTHV